MKTAFWRAMTLALWLILLLLNFGLAQVAGDITTIAGNGVAGYSGDSGPATVANLNYPYGVHVDFDGNVYIADQQNHRIRKVDLNEEITTVAGDGIGGFYGDNVQATQTSLYIPNGVFVDGTGDIFIADSWNNRIRKVDANGIITTVAGNGSPGYSGDGGLATLAKLNHPYGVFVDGPGNIYIADSDNRRVRKVDLTGIISTVAGNGTAGFAGDGGPAVSAGISFPTGVYLDASGNLYIGGMYDQRVRKVDGNGIITTFAGNGTGGYSGDGGPATQASLWNPTDVYSNGSGDLYIADSKNHRIRKVDANGEINTVAGNGIKGFSGDDGPATVASFSTPYGVAGDQYGNLYIADFINHRVRKITPSLLPNIVQSQQKISDLHGNFEGILDDYDQFGLAVCFLGDLDGDGTDDIATGAPYDDDGGTNRGAVWILFMKPDGTIKSYQKISSSAGGLGDILDNYDLFGFSLARLPDMDGDHNPELAVGAIGDDDGEGASANRGAVWVLFLNADGTVKSYQKISEMSGGFSGALGNDDQLGNAITNLGDIDGDGIVDLAVGARYTDDGGYDRGAVWILFMNAAGTVKADRKISATSSGFSGSLDDSDLFGYGLTGLGDLDGDGYLDLAVGARGDDDGGPERGAVWILFLNPDGTVKSQQKISDMSGTFFGTLDDNEAFGVSMARLGDLDGDGYLNLAVGATGDDDGGHGDHGAIWVLSLNTDGTVASYRKISKTAGGFSGIVNGNYLASSLGAMGDVNGDGVTDLLAGAAEHDGGLNRGAVWTLFLDGLPASGTITGRVSIELTGLEGVTVKLLDISDPTNVIADMATDAGGGYAFTEVPAGDYQLMIVEPLGYLSNQNEYLVVDLEAGETETVDFELSAFVVVNQARSKGYWKHQFDVYVKNKGHAQESEQDLLSYIAEVENRYSIYFNIFDGLTDGTNDFEEWQAVLSVKGKAGMEAKAKAQLAALVFNLMSLKVAQYEVVTADGKTAGDVLTYVSELIEDGDGANDELAKDLAEQVNVQHTIAAGLVTPSQTILYKKGKNKAVAKDLARIPNDFELFQNYPNPFNPATTIRYALTESGSVSLRIYNSAGRLVRTLMSEEKGAGFHQLQWDSNNDTGAAVASGIYFYRLSARNYTATRKMVLMQ